jgi:hypothetical protein
MKTPPDAVTIEVLDHAKPVPARSALNCSAQFTESDSWLSSLHGVALCKFCCLQESGGNR